MSVHVFGVRHHGPGSARSVRGALEALKPSIVLVEGPPDADGALPYIGDATMKPPVALLVYATDAPSRAVFYPFAAFSPEWQALIYAAQSGVPARFMDLPQAYQLGDDGGNETSHDAKAPAPPDSVEPSEEPEAAEDGPLRAEPQVPNNDPEDDPLGALARAAGYADRELWWEHQVEQRSDARELFEGILEAMTALREGKEPRDTREARREAFMRRTIRTAEKEGHDRIAVVCGAWHAPALLDGPSAKKDDALLAGMRKVKTEATWIPWTYSRLAYRSGYGAGVNSPGWYAHLWAAPDRAPVRWLSRLAQLLRASDLDVSPASVIEAVRLSETLAAMRDLPMAGLRELTDAAESVLCRGDRAPLALVRVALEIGNEIGEVPEGAPAVPLQRDLTAAQKRLRLKATTEVKPLELDLRNETDRARSCLLHRLNLLRIPWGKHERVQGNKAGTFHERWTLQWHPEFAVQIVEASLFGNTVESAATGRAGDDAHRAELGVLTALLDAALLAELPAAVEKVLARVQEEAAQSADVRRLMEGLAPLARTARYGTVRETKTDQLLTIIDGLFERVVVGLIPACASLDDTAATTMLDAIIRANESIVLLDRAAQREEWAGALAQLRAKDSVHGLVRGGACRVLVEQHLLSGEELERTARLALSHAVPPRDAAAWIEGLLKGSALLLLHYDGVWTALDEWITGLSDEVFVEMLPLVRRSFSMFQAAERRQMGERVKGMRLGQAGGQPTTGLPELDQRRAALVYPVLGQILGVELV